MESKYKYKIFFGGREYVTNNYCAHNGPIIRGRFDARCAGGLLTPIGNDIQAPACLEVYEIVNGVVDDSKVCRISASAPISALLGDGDFKIEEIKNEIV